MSPVSSTHPPTRCGSPNPTGAAIAVLLLSSLVPLAAADVQDFVSEIRNPKITRRQVVVWPQTSYDFEPLLSFPGKKMISESQQLDIVKSV